jgi:hypothetical protein
MTGGIWMFYKCQNPWLKTYFHGELAIANLMSIHGPTFFAIAASHPDHREIDPSTVSAQLDDLFDHLFAVNLQLDSSLAEVGVALFSFFDFLLSGILTGVIPDHPWAGQSYCL